MDEAHINVVPLSRPDSAVPIQELLADLGRRAEAGEVKSFAYAYVSTDGVIHTGWVQGHNGMFNLQAAVSALAFRYVRDMVEGD